MIKKLILTLTFLAPILLLAQSKFLDVTGKVLDAETEKKLKPIVVTIRTASGKEYQVDFTKNKFQFYLRPNEYYKIYVETAGYKTKSFEIDAQNISNYYAQKNYESEVDINMEPLTSKNQNKPQPKMGVLRFNQEVEGFEWDIQLSEQERMRRNLKYGDSSLINKPPQLSAPMSQALIFEISDLNAPEIDAKKPQMSKVFNDLIAGMHIARSAYYAGQAQNSKAMEHWNTFQKLTNKQMNVASSIEELYGNFNQYEGFTDSLFYVRLGEWLEMSHISLQAKDKYKQQSFYLNFLETFVVRLDSRKLTDAELSFVAELKTLVPAIKLFSRLNSVASTPKVTADLEKSHQEIKFKIDQICANFYAK